MFEYNIGVTALGYHEGRVLFLSAILRKSVCPRGCSLTVGRCSSKHTFTFWAGTQREEKQKGEAPLPVSTKGCCHPSNANRSPQSGVWSKENFYSCKPFAN